MRSRNTTHRPVTLTLQPKKIVDIKLALVEKTQADKTSEKTKEQNEVRKAYQLPFFTRRISRSQSKKSLKDSSQDASSEDENKQANNKNLTVYCYSAKRQGSSLGLDHGKSLSISPDNEKEKLNTSLPLASKGLPGSILKSRWMVRTAGINILKQKTE